MAPTGTHYSHTSEGGFCTVCGSVWPCAQAGKVASVPPMRPGS